MSDHDSSTVDEDEVGEVDEVEVVVRSSNGSVCRLKVSQEPHGAK